jgi:hypothetical protein
MSTLQRDIENKDNLIQLIRLICDEYKLDPTLSSNITNIKAFLAPLSVDVISRKVKSLDEANKYITKLYGDTVKANTVDLVSDLDKVKDYMVKTIKKPGDEAKNKAAAYNKFGNKEGFSNDSVLSMSSENRIAYIKYTNYQSLFREEYIVIDSRYQNTVNTDTSKLEFSLITNTKTKSDHGGIIVGNPLQDIVELEIYPFTIPYKPVYATFYNKITLTINEWTANSFEAYEGGQYHFSFDIDKIDNNLIYLRPINNVYTFSKPVNQIDTFSLSFGAVYPKISFDPDRMIPSSISYTDELGLITFGQPHNLVSGDLIYITGFNTPFEALDVDTITEVNRPEGHVIVKKDNYSFIINVDLSILHHEYPANSGKYPIDEYEQDVSIYFASKRIQVQMRLRYLTNYS